jgi:hypothetical protein
MIDTASARSSAQAVRRAIEGELRTVNSTAARTVGSGTPGGFVSGQATGIAGEIKTLALSYIGLQAAMSAVRGAIDLAQLSTQSARAASSFDILSGSADKAKANVLAIQAASRGTVDSMTAMKLGTQAAALGLANTSAEFDRLVSAARLVVQVSPTIKDIGDAMSQLSLFSSNETSFMRADQLGLAAGEVKDRMKELRAENENLTGSQAKLEASLQLITEKFGALTATTAAQASGIEKLTVAWTEFRIAVSGSTGPVQAVAASLADGFNQMTVLINGTAAPIGVLIGNLERMAAQTRIVENADPIAKGLAWLNGTDLNAGSQKLDIVTTSLKNAMDVVTVGVPGSGAILAQISGIAVEVDKWNYATDEQIAKLRTLNAQMDALIISGGAAQAAAITAEQAAAAAAGARATSIINQAEPVSTGLDSAAAKNVGTLGLEQTIALLKAQKTIVDQAINDLIASSVTDPAELSLRIAQIQQAAQQAFTDAAAAAPVMPEIDPGITSGSFALITQSLADLNNAYVDVLPSMAAARDELISLSDEVAYSGVVTEAQAASLEYLAGAAMAVSNETGLLAELTNELGFAFLAANPVASGLVDAMYQAQASYLAGTLTASQYAGVMAALGGQLLTLASEAGVATSAILQLNAAQGGASGLPGFAQGQAIGGGIAQRIQTKQAGIDRTRMRNEAEAAARRASAESLRGARAAGNAGGRALVDGAKAAATELRSALQSVPGLFGRSPVTAEQMKQGAAGVPQNFADDYLRRLEDEVFNKHDWADVSIEEAKAALEKVGISASGDAKTTFDQFAQAWESSVLFSDKANLNFINQEAVKLAQSLEEKAKQGQANIFELFGVAVDEAVSAVGAGISGGGGVSGSAAGGYTIPIQAQLIPMGADAADGATGTFALTPTLDTATLQAQLDLLTLPAFDMTVMGLADLQAQIDGLAPTIKPKFDIDATNYQDFLTKVESTVISLEPRFVATPTNLSEMAFAAESQAQINIPVGLYSTLETMQELAAIVEMTKITIPVTFGGGGGVDLGMGLVTQLNAQFDANANFFYAAGLVPAESVKNGYKGSFGAGSADLILPMVQAINTGIRSNTENLRNQGITMAQYVQVGFAQAFNGETFKSAIIAAGEVMAGYLQIGILSGINGGAIADAIGAKVLADLTAEVAAP